MADVTDLGLRAVARSSEVISHTSEDWSAALRLRKPNGYHGHPLVGDHPRAGYWRIKRDRENAIPVHIVEFTPTDEETGQVIGDVTYQAFVRGQQVGIADVWPWCGRMPLSQQEYDELEALAPVTPLDASVVPPADEPEHDEPILPERPTMEAMPKEVAEAVNAVMGSVGYVQKRGTNTFHNYKFAAIGDVLGKLQPAMAEHGLIVVQDEVSHRLTADNALMEASYTFALIHKSGATWNYPARHTGLAGARNTKGGYDDKALNKCHTAARKYFLMALFQIPTGEQDDPDHQEDQPAPPSKPRSVRDNPAEQEANTFANNLAGQIDACMSVNALEAIMGDARNAKAVARLKEEYPQAHAIVDRAEKRRRAFLTPGKAA